MRLLPRSLRSRLLVAFVATTTVLVLVTSLVVFVTMSDELVDVVDAALADRAAALEADARAGDLDVVGDDRLVQVFAADGSLRFSAAGVPEGATLVDGAVLAQIGADGDRVSGSRRVAGVPSKVRYLAVGVESPDGLDVIVVGRRLRAVAESRENIRFGLLVGTPLLALAIAVIGVVLVRRALSPVRAMARRASRTQADGRTIQLEEPPGRDEFNELAVAINDLLARIEAVRQHERGFIADVSHELRTPFTILRGELELARLGVDDPEMDRTLASAIDEIDRLTDLIRRLLTMARVEAGLDETGTSTADVCAELERVRDSIVASGARPVAVQLDCSIADPLPIDRDIVAQIMTNLMANAARHARSAVTVVARADHEMFRLVVTDDGPGFPETVLGDSFDRFRPGGRSPAGTGLGLAIVDQLCRYCGGTVSAGNGPAGGARVEVTLPLLAVAPTRP